MKKVQFKQLVIHDYEESVFHLPLHSHTYYELVYIHKGEGIHILNNSRFSYKKGDLFIISPEDEHYFEIAKSTHFTFIKFTDDYFSSQASPTLGSFFAIQPDLIMSSKVLKEVKLTIKEPYKSILKSTVNNIVKYDSSKSIDTSSLMYHQVFSILGVIKEVATIQNLRIDNGQTEKEQMITYIHQHIYDPSLMLIKNISKHFAISPNYFSDYFKNKFGISYQAYLSNYRMSIIEKRLLVASISLSQIAHEFKFSDESHLHKFFKKHKGMSPRAFRLLHNVS